MNQNEYQSKPIAYAIETTPGVSHVFSDPETLANMVALYEECDFPVFPTLMAQKIDGQFSVLITSIRIHASSTELHSLEEFFYYRGQHDVSVWSWHLLPGTGKNKDQFVWRFPQGEDMNLRGPVLSIHHYKNTDNEFLFGTPDDMEHVWEMYRSLGKIPVRTDYTGENISSMVIPLEDMNSLRSLVAEQDKTRILNTLEYKEYRDILIEQVMENNRNSSEPEDGFGGW